MYFLNLLFKYWLSYICDLSELLTLFFHTLNLFKKSKATHSCYMRKGVQSSSNSNHRHPNLFCGKRAPQLVITVKFCFLWFEFNALLTQFSTSIGVIWHLYWLKLNFQIIFRSVRLGQQKLRFKAQFILAES